MFSILDTTSTSSQSNLNVTSISSVRSWLVRIISESPAWMSSNNETLPSSAFESLLPKLLTILQVTQRPEGTTNARNKQDLLQAVRQGEFCSWWRSTLNPLKTDSSLPRSYESRAWRSGCTSWWRIAHRGAKWNNCHAREVASKEKVRSEHLLLDTKSAQNCGPDYNCRTSRTRSLTPRGTCPNTVLHRTRRWK